MRFFPGSKRLGVEGDHSSRYSVGIKNGWKCNIIHSLCLHCIHKDNFICHLMTALLIRHAVNSPSQAVAARSKALVCGRSFAGIADSNPVPGGMDVCSLWVLCVLQVEVTATGRSLVQRSPTEYCVSECERGTAQRRPRFTGGCRDLIKKFLHYGNFFGFNFGLSLTKVNLKFNRIGIEPVVVQTG